MNRTSTNKKILIADSGATNTDWCLTSHGEILSRFSGNGISPVYQSQEEIANEIQQYIFPLFKEYEIHSIVFYGAGCSEEKSELVKKAIQQSFMMEEVYVYSDLMAATHSLCGNEPGIACILGTGSNSCEWNGSKIVSQVSPLGFILGDEGSGAHLGKLLISDALKNQLTPGMKEKLLGEYNLTPSLVIEKVYREPFPSRFLASLAPFLLNNLTDNSIRNIINKSFTKFFERNVKQYNYNINIVHFVGSVAFHFGDILKEVASANGIKIGQIEQSPIPGLIRYYK